MKLSIIKTKTLTKEIRRRRRMFIATTIIKFILQIL